MQNEPPVPNAPNASSQPNQAASTSSADFTSLNLTDQPSYSAGQQSYSAADDIVAKEYRQQSISGARWFFWVAGLSIINSFIIMNEGNWAFLAGLAITEVISGLALGLSTELGASVTIIAFVLDVFVAGIFALFGWFAQKGHTWAFIVGLIFYVLDGLIFVYFQEWLSVAFHAFVVYCLIRGLMANQNWKSAQVQSPVSA